MHGEHTVRDKVDNRLTRENFSEAWPRLGRLCGRVLAADRVELLIPVYSRVCGMSVREKGGCFIHSVSLAAVLARISPEEPYEFLSELETVVPFVLSSF
jgi:hypothetical protein